VVNARANEWYTDCYWCRALYTLQDRFRSDCCSLFSQCIL